MRHLSKFNSETAWCGLLLNPDELQDARASFFDNTDAVCPVCVFGKVTDDEEKIDLLCIVVRSIHGLVAQTNDMYLDSFFKQKYGPDIFEAHRLKDLPTIIHEMCHDAELAEEFVRHENNRERASKSN